MKSTLSRELGTIQVHSTSKMMTHPFYFSKLAPYLLGSKYFIFRHLPPTMVDSDDDYVGGSDDDVNVVSASRDASSGTHSKSTRANKEPTGFEVARTWENLTEGADGTITGAVEGLLQAGKRQRSFRPTTKG